MKRLFCIIGLITALAAPAALAQQMVFGGNSKLQITNDQQVLFEAANKVMNRDFASAEGLYSQAIAMNGRNIDAWLQRAVTRRELGNEAGMQSDARTVIALSDEALQQTPQNANLFYERGMGYRLLRDYDKAREDISTGMRIGGRSSWQTDLQAIELERKEGR
jgi:tetratricopeptide (TPR) repeat protein